MVSKHKSNEFPKRRPINLADYEEESGEDLDDNLHDLEFVDEGASILYCQKIVL